MAQWVSRGTEIAPNIRIRKMLAEGQEWQIYSSSTDQYVLFLTERIRDFWKNNYDVSSDIFSEYEDWYVFFGSGNYLISSLEKGPFPSEEMQIAAFAQAFGAFIKAHPKTPLNDGIYIEEYSLLLPGIGNDTNTSDAGIVFGRWIAGGVGISVESFERMADFVSWIPTNRLYKYANQAGFKVAEVVPKNMKAPRKDVGEKEAAFSLVGRPELETFFKDNIIDIVENSEQYMKMGIGFPGATILHGPPGCGKTFAVEKLTDYLNWPRFDIDASAIASPYIHDTSKKIGEVFDAAIQCAPSVIVIDEMEAFLSDRQSLNGSSEHHMEEMAEFLRRIPQAIDSNVLILAMTNIIDNIDPAILRRGRFDHVIEVKMPQKEEIAALLKRRFDDLPISSDVDIDKIAEKLDGHPMSDVTFMIREAGRIAVKQKLEYMNSECFEEAIKLIAPIEPPKRTIGFKG